MMYYGGNGGWSVWIGMGLSMIVFWGVLIGVAFWAIRSFSQGDARPQKSTAMGILEERYARGKEITANEFTNSKQLIK